MENMGRKSVDTIKKDPYALCTSEYGIDFETAEESQQALDVLRNRAGFAADFYLS
jgi:hypothetical protein